MSRPGIRPRQHVVVLAIVTWLVTVCCLFAEDPMPPVRPANYLAQITRIWKQRPVVVVGPVRTISSAEMARLITDFDARLRAFPILVPPVVVVFTRADLAGQVGELIAAVEALPKRSPIRCGGVSCAFSPTSQ